MINPLCVDARYYFHGVQFEFVDSCKDSDVVVDVKLRYHELVRI